MKWFREGLAFKAHIILYHSTLGLRVIQEKKEEEEEDGLHNLLEEDVLNNLFETPSCGVPRCVTIPYPVMWRVVALTDLDGVCTRTPCCWSTFLPERPGPSHPTIGSRNDPRGVVGSITCLRGMGSCEARRAASSSACWHQGALAVD